jgi:hypothetical protein
VQPDVRLGVRRSPLVEQLGEPDGHATGRQSRLQHADDYHIPLRREILHVLRDECATLTGGRRGDLGVRTSVQTEVTDVNCIVTQFVQQPAHSWREHLVDEESHPSGRQQVVALLRRGAGSLGRRIVCSHLGFDHAAVGGGEVDGDADMPWMQVELLRESGDPLLRSA